MYNPNPNGLCHRLVKCADQNPLALRMRSSAILHCWTENPPQTHTHTRPLIRELNHGRKRVSQPRNVHCSLVFIILRVFQIWQHSWATILPLYYGCATYAKCVRCSPTRQIERQSNNNSEITVKSQQAQLPLASRTTPPNSNIGLEMG